MMEKYRLRDGLTKRGFCRKIGISEAMLYRLYAGSRKPGRKVLRNLLRAYPESREEILRVLRNGGGDDEREGT
ncbi:MAG: helix-turn-helix domain-containing protein [Methanotrichaceae archaeon]